MYEPGMPHDMALLRLDGDIDLSNEFVSTIKMGEPTMNYAGNPDCYISGWGRNGE